MFGQSLTSLFSPKENSSIDEAQTVTVLLYHKNICTYQCISHSFMDFWYLFADDDKQRVITLRRVNKLMGPIPMSVRSTVNRSTIHSARAEAFELSLCAGERAL